MKGPAKARAEEMREVAGRLRAQRVGTTGWDVLVVRAVALILEDLAAHELGE